MKVAYHEGDRTFSRQPNDVYQRMAGRRMKEISERERSPVIQDCGEAKDPIPQLANNTGHQTARV